MKWLCFPPVSGGAEALPHPTYFAITAENLDIAAIHERLAGRMSAQSSASRVWCAARRSAMGCRRKRSTSNTKRTAKWPKKRWRRLRARFGSAGRWCSGVAIVQRIGRLEVGDVTTFVACAAGHRDQGAFEAARYGIDRLKEIVPVWKKEIGPDQSEWVEGTYRPSPDDNR